MLHAKKEPADNKPQLLLTIDEGMRPRAKSAPSIGPVVLPEIMVEDFSVPDNTTNADVAIDGLAVPQQRQRANTCPEEMFRKRRNRPATPPPIGRKAGGPNKFVFKIPPKREPVSFVVHKLGKLAEDSESATFSCFSNSEGRHKSEAHRRKSCSDTRVLKDCSFRSRLPFKDSFPASFPLKDPIPSRLPLTGTKEAADCISENSCVLSEPAKCESTVVCSQGQEERGLCHSEECRYTSSLSRAMDGTQLQAY